MRSHDRQGSCRTVEWRFFRHTGAGQRGRPPIVPANWPVLRAGWSLNGPVDGRMIASKSIPAHRRRMAPSQLRYPARRTRDPLSQHLPGSGRPLGPVPVSAHRADTDSAPHRTPHRNVPSTGNLRKLKNPNSNNQLSLDRPGELRPGRIRRRSTGFHSESVLQQGDFIAFDFRPVKIGGPVVDRAEQGRRGARTIPTRRSGVAGMVADGPQSDRPVRPNHHGPPAQPPGTPDDPLRGRVAAARPSAAPDRPPPEAAGRPAGGLRPHRPRAAARDRHPILEPAAQALDGTASAIKTPARRE